MPHLLLFSTQTPWTEASSILSCCQGMEQLGGIVDDAEDSETQAFKPCIHKHLLNLRID